MSAKIIVSVCWTGDENGEYDVETMIDSFIEQLGELTGDTLIITVERGQGNGRQNIL